MLQKLLSDALDDGINHMCVSSIIENGDLCLLLEKPYEITGKSVYEAPHATLLDDETLLLALKRTIASTTSLSLKEISRYLGYVDEGQKRTFYFLVTVDEPNLVSVSDYVGFVWAEKRAALGYPISDELRDVIDRLLHA